MKMPDLPRYVATDTREIMVPDPIGAWVRWDDAREAVRMAVEAERERCVQQFKYWLGNGDSRYEASCLEAIKSGRQKEE